MLNVWRQIHAEQDLKDDIFKENLAIVALKQIQISCKQYKLSLPSCSPRLLHGSA
jgi:hypothetical protein